MKVLQRTRETLDLRELEGSDRFYDFSAINTGTLLDYEMKMLLLDLEIATWTGLPPTVVTRNRKDRERVDDWRRLRDEFCAAHPEYFGSLN